MQSLAPQNLAATSVAAVAPADTSLIRQEQLEFKLEKIIGI